MADDLNKTGQDPATKTDNATGGDPTKNGNTPAGDSSKGGTGSEGLGSGATGSVATGAEYDDPGRDELPSA
jgi:hypothetical protein